MAQNFWTLALLLGLVKTRLAFSHSGMELSHLVVNETLDTWRQSFVFAADSVNLTTTLILPCMGLQNALLMALERTPLAIVPN